MTRDVTEGLTGWNRVLSVYAEKGDILRISLLDDTRCTVRIKEVGGMIVHAELLDDVELSPKGYTHFPVMVLKQVSMHHRDNQNRRYLNRLLESDP